jgi:hypothetical protein
MGGWAIPIAILIALPVILFRAVRDKIRGLFHRKAK